MKDANGMIFSDYSTLIKDLFLKYGFDYNVAAKQYITHHNLQDWQLSFLLQHGLKPEHSLLDIGCGWLRLAQAVIPYLQEGHYYGIDPTQVHLDIGLELLRESGIKPGPNLICDQDFSFDRFGTQFDFAFCHAVFTHLNHDQIRECLVKLKKVMKPTGVLYATFYRSRKDYDDRSVYKISAGEALSFSSAHITLGFFGELLKNLELSWDYLGRLGHPTGQHVIEVRFGGSSKSYRAGSLPNLRRTARRLKRAVQTFLED